MKVKNRVKSHQDFQKIIHHSSAFKSPFYAIYYQSNNLGYTRVGISASTKLGNAVTRVKIRRQVRAMFSGLWDLDIPADIVIIVRSNYNIEKYNECRAELDNSLNKIRRKFNEQKN